MGKQVFNSNMILGEDSPKEDDIYRIEAEMMFDKICKSYPLAKSLAAAVSDFFTHKSKIDMDFKTTISHYELMKGIGKGTFGKVHLGIQILTGAKVALKAISKKHLMLDEAGKKKNRDGD